MTNPNITLYGAYWCPDCRRSKQFLGEHQIPYNWIDIEEDPAGEKFVIEDECTFLFCSIGYGKSKCGNNFFEKKLRMQATARNYRTVQKLIELSA